MNINPPAALEPLQTELQHALESRHGPLLGGKALVLALGYNNLAALRQARRRGHVDVKLFTLPNRRGFFALTRDVARWLINARMGTFKNLAMPEGSAAPTEH